jgi:hypothetical protein
VKDGQIARGNPSYSARHANRRTPGAKWRLVGALALACLLIQVGTPAIAQSGVGVQIEVGYDNRFLPDRWMPVSVTVESSRAIAGELELSIEQPDGSRSLHSLGVEIPAGGRKRFDVVVPGPPDERQVVAQVISDKSVIGQAATRPLALGNAALVAVLDQPIPPSLNGIRTQPALTEMIPVALSSELLDLGSSGLEPLTYVVAGGHEIASASQEHVDALLGWVVTGGRLIVVAENPDDLSGLAPAARIQWSPSGTSVVAADRTLDDGRAGLTEVGYGELIVSRGSLSTVTGSHFRALLGSPHRANPVDGSGDFFGGWRPTAEFELINARRGRGSQTQLGWFVGFLAAYLLLVGPINYFVLKRRGRKELLWITVPFLALAFSGVAYGLARGSRADLIVATAGIVIADEDGGRGRSVVVVSSSTGGERRISFPTEASFAPSLLSFEGSSQLGSTRITPGGAEVSIQTSAFSYHSARSTIETFDGYIDTTLTPGGKGLRYEVTNRTPYRLSDTTLLYKGERVMVGDLEPGGSTEGTFVPRLNVPGVRGATLSGALRRALDRELRSMLPPGPMSSPYVAASVEGYELNTSLDDRPLGEAGRLLLASPARLAPEATATHLSASLGRMHLVALDNGSFDQGVPGSIVLQDFREAIFSYRPHAGVDAGDIAEGRITLTFRGGNHRLERFDWDTERWTPVPGKVRRLLDEPVPGTTFSESGEAFFRLQTNGHGYAEIATFDVQPVLK